MRHERGATKLRVMYGTEIAIGPGKAELLEAIAATGSISESARRLGMSYRRAWLLVDDLNRCFREPVVSAQPGGSRGGGAELTRFGHGLISSYRAIEADAHAATAAQLGGLQASLRGGRRKAALKPRKISGGPRSVKKA